MAAMSGLMAFGMHTFVDAGAADGSIREPSAQWIGMLLQGASTDTRSAWDDIDALGDDLSVMRH